jgi:hypothetical protein
MTKPKLGRRATREGDWVKIGEMQTRSVAYGDDDASVRQLAAG